MYVYIHIHTLHESCGLNALTHWGRMTHICVNKLTIIGSDNGLSPARRQAIIWTNAGILLNGPLGANFSEILIGIQTFSFTKMHLKMSSAKWRPFCLGFNVLMHLLLAQRHSPSVFSLLIYLVYIYNAHSLSSVSAEPWHYICQYCMLIVHCTSANW